MQIQDGPWLRAVVITALAIGAAASVALVPPGWLALAPLAWAQEQAPSAAAIAGPHGDHAIGAVSEDGRTLSMAWESAPAPRVQNGSDWAPYLIERDPSGATHFTSAHVNATLYEQDCSLRTPANGGRIIHRLLTAPPVGAWEIHEASYLECRVTIDENTGRVTAHAENADGIDWLIHYDFSPDGTELEWTYSLRVTDAEAAGQHYGFRTHLFGAPILVNGSRAAAGSDYQRPEAVALPMQWGPHLFDLKDAEHNATSSVRVTGHTMATDGIDLPRKHPHRTAPQIVADFTHGSEVMAIGATRIVDPSISVATVYRATLTADHPAGLARNACHQSTTGNAIHGQAIGAYQWLGVTLDNGNAHCRIHIFNHQLPTGADPVRITSASLTYSQGAGTISGLPFPQNATWIFFGGHYAPPTISTSTAVGIWDWTAAAISPPAVALNPATVAPANPVAQQTPPILASSAPPGASSTSTLAADPHAANYYIHRHLRDGDRVASVLAWQLDGVVLDASQARAASTTVNPTLAIEYEQALQPIASAVIDFVVARPLGVAFFDYDPPYQRLTILVNQSETGASVPTAVELRVREAGASSWLRADADNDDPLRIDSAGNFTLYSNRVLDAFPDGGHNLEGRGPFEWQARALYSIGGSNNVQGPWVELGGAPLCGSAPLPPVNLTVARFSPTSPALHYTWAPNPQAPPDECGAVTYNLRAIDELQTERYFSVTGHNETYYTYTYPAFEQVRFYIAAVNQYGTSSEIEISATAPAHGHRAVTSFSVSGLRLPPDAAHPSITREDGGSAFFEWTVNETATTDPGVLYASHYNVYYLRTDSTDGHVYRQTIDNSPPHARSLEFNYTTPESFRFNAAGGFLPGVEYTVGIEPYYADGFRGPALTAEFIGARDRVTSSEMGRPVNATTGHSISNEVTINATIVDVIHEPGVQYVTRDADGIVWIATYSKLDPDLGAPVAHEIGDWAHVALPAVSTTKDCAPDSKGDDPCEFLRPTRDEISARALTAYMYSDSDPVAGLMRDSEFDVPNLLNPCVTQIPTPTGLALEFIYRPGAGAPAASDHIGIVNATWNAVPSIAPGSRDCTYGVESYTLRISIYKPDALVGSSIVAHSGIRGTSYEIEDARSAAIYAGHIQAIGSHAGDASPPPPPRSDYRHLPVYIGTLPWPAASVTATDYPLPRPHTVRIDWQAPPHLPTDGLLTYRISDGVRSTFSLDGGPADDGDPGRHTTPVLQPADWRCYAVQACIVLNPADHAIQACATYPGGSPQACAEPHYLPDAVDDLTGEASVGAVRLQWSAPDAKSSRGILDYQINWTSPYGTPDQVIDKAAGNETSHLISHLPLHTGSSIRVAAETIHTRQDAVNITGATVLNVHPSLDFVAGELDLTNETRDIPTRGPHIDLRAVRDGADVTVELSWPADRAGAVNCRVDVPAASRNYTAGVLPDGPADSDGMLHGNLTLAQLAARHAEIDCEGGAVRTTAGGERIPAVAGSLAVESDPAGAALPFLEWIADFRAGEWGTTPTIGAFDLVTLIVIIVSMIGFNRSSPAMGLIFSIIVISVAAYFGLIEFPGVIMGILALLIMVAVIVTRRGSQEPA